MVDEALMVMKLQQWWKGFVKSIIDGENMLCFLSIWLQIYTTIDKDLFSNHKYNEDMATNVFITCQI